MLGDDPRVALKQIEDLERRSRACIVRVGILYEDNCPSLAEYVFHLAMALQAIANGRRRFHGFPITVR